MMSEDSYDHSLSDSGSDEKDLRPFLPQDRDGDEELSFDSSVYEYFEQIETQSSFLSFDLIPIFDQPTKTDKTLTYTFYIASGTQVDGHLFISKIFSVQALDHDDYDSDHSPPKVVNIGMKHSGGINRIKHTLIDNKNIVAAWSENGFVGVYDVTKETEKLRKNKGNSEDSSNLNLIYKNESHKTEGFALDWCKLTPKRFASGDNNGLICISSIDDPSHSVKLQANSLSVEDLQWSPREADVLASCGCDSHISIWDVRSSSKQPLRVKASDCDVNVMSWSKYDPFILSGDDNGIIKLWDIRKLESANSKPVLLLNFHKKAITSIEWHPLNFPYFAASSEDRSITQWDISAEPVKPGKDLVSSVPPQVLFIHMCEHEAKEIHWHPYNDNFIVGVTESTFEIFKSISL